MNDNPIKYSDLVKPDDSIEKLIKQLDELNDSYMNFTDNVKKNAAALKEALTVVSGATEAGRKTIRETAGDTDRLTKAIKARNEAEANIAVEIARVKNATHEANVVAKLRAKIADSEEGSYNRLSAQYALNKFELNQMSEEERKATEYGQKLEKETAAIYEEMKRLQEATGKHQLSVGDYGIATEGLRQQIMKLTEDLVRLRLEGKQNSDEYKATAEKAAFLKDAFKDAQAEVQNLASDTSALDSVLGGMAAAGGGISAVTGAMHLFGGESKEVQEAQKKLQAAIALTNGLTAIQKNLQHQAALMLGIKKIQLAAAAKAEALAAKNTWAATAAQKAFNVVAKANPYVLLATALVTVVGAIVAFTRGSKEATVSTVEQDKAVRNLNDALKEYNMQMDFAIRKAEAEGKSTEEINALKRRQANEQINTATAILNVYDAEVSKLLKLKQETRKWSDEQQNALTTALDNQKEAWSSLMEAFDNARKLDEDIQITTIQNAKKTQDNLTSILRKAQDQRNALIEDQYDRERAQRKTATKNAIDDIKKQLKEDTNLTLEGKAALNEQIKLYRQQLNADLKAIDDKQRKDAETANLEAIRAAQDVQLSLMEEGAEKRLRLLEIEHQREIEDIDRRLQNEKDLTQEQMTALFAMRLNLENKYNSDMQRLKDEAALEAFDQQQEFEASEFALLNKSEAKKTQFRLQQEKARLQKVLELGMMNGKALSDIEVATIKNTIERINSEISQSQVPQDIYDVFGLDLSDDKKAAIDTSMQYAMAALNQWMDLRVQAAEKAVEAANKEVDAAQRAYELELEAKANGYAADVENSKKELDLAKQNQQKALEQQKEAQAQQEKLQTIQQMTNLITGAAQIWGAFGATPYIAIPLIAMMFASFAASKIMARQAAQEQYAEGTVELLQGGSHASGNDIDLGTKPDGTRRRAEGGEFFAVINRRSSRKYRREIPQVIHALNDGTFADKYLNTFDVGNVTIGGTNQSAVDLMPLSDDVKAIREQGAHRYIVLADGTMVEMYKNLTRRVIC